MLRMDRSGGQVRATSGLEAADGGSDSVDVQRPAGGRGLEKAVVVAKKRSKVIPKRPRIQPLNDTNVYPCSMIAEQFKIMRFEEFESCWVAMVLDTLLLTDHSPSEVARLLRSVREVYRDKR